MVILRFDKLQKQSNAEDFTQNVMTHGSCDRAKYRLYIMNISS